MQQQSRLQAQPHADRHTNANTGHTNANTDRDNAARKFSNEQHAKVFNHRHKLSIFRHFFVGGEGGGHYGYIDGILIIIVCDPEAMDEGRNKDAHTHAGWKYAEGDANWWLVADRRTIARVDATGGWAYWDYDHVCGVYTSAVGYVQKDVRISELKKAPPPPLTMLCLMICWGWCWGLVVGAVVVVVGWWSGLSK